MKKLVCGVFAVAAVALAGRLVAEDKADAKPKFKIKDVMEKAHKGGDDSLRNRVLAGKASKKEIDTLVELYAELGKNTPPMGSKEAWKKKTAEVLAAAKKVKADPEDKKALAAYSKATACMACHDTFKKDDD